MADFSYPTVTVGAPIGGATAANQVLEIADLDAIKANQTNNTQTTNIVGTVPLPTGAATSANQVTQETTLSAIQANQTNGNQVIQVSNFPATQPVSGTVAVSNFPATQPVSGTVTANAGTNLNTSALSLEATQAAFKAANHTDLAAINTTLGSPLQAGGSVSVSNFPATQPVSGTVAVSNFPATQPVSGPLTDAQLRATPVPVSGSFTSTVASVFTPSVVALVAATPTLIVALNTLRVNALIYNNTGATMYVGNSGVAATDMPVPSMAYFFYDDTAALYGYSVLGGNVNVFDEET